MWQSVMNPGSIHLQIKQKGGQMNCRYFNRFRFLTLMATLALTACSSMPPPGIQPVSGFDVHRYAGKWYEMARLDHVYERGLANSVSIPAS